MAAHTSQSVAKAAGDDVENDAAARGLSRRTDSKAPGGTKGDWGAPSPPTGTPGR